jgi:hypothetical protein
VAVATLLGVAGGACGWSGLDGLSRGDPGTTTPDGGGPTVGQEAGSSSGGPGSDGGLPLLTGGDAGPSDPYGDAVRADHPINWFRFEGPGLTTGPKDEITGKLAIPSSGVKFGTDGVIGQAADFDGSGGLSFGNVDGFAGKVPFAFEWWVKTAANGGDQQLIAKRSASGPNLIGNIIYLASDGTVHYEGWGTGLDAWTDTAIPTAFTHVVLSVSYAGGKGNATLWINGQQAPHGGFDNTDDLPSNTTSLLFGDTLVGKLDELAIYDHELTYDRISAHYVAARPPQ